MKTFSSGLAQTATARPIWLLALVDGDKSVQQEQHILVDEEPGLTEAIFVQVLEQLRELALPQHPESASPRKKI